MMEKEEGNIHPKPVKPVFLAKAKTVKPSSSRKISVKPPKSGKEKDRSTKKIIPSFSNELTNSFQQLESKEDLKMIPEVDSPKSKDSEDPPPEASTKDSSYKDLEEKLEEATCQISDLLIERLEEQSCRDTVDRATSPFRLASPEAPAENEDDDEYIEDDSEPDEEYAEVKHFCKESTLCKRVYKSATALKKHINAVHKPAVLHGCPQCSKEFKTKAYLKQHMESHMKPTINCDMCDEEFKSEYKLKCHMKNIHPNEAPVCEVCGKTFETRENRRKHVKSCFKKNNKLKYKSKDKENVAPLSQQPEAPDNSAEPQVSFSLVSGSLDLMPTLTTIPISSEDSPTLVESLPVYEVLSFSEY